MEDIYKFMGTNMDLYKGLYGYANNVNIKMTQKIIGLLPTFKRIPMC